MKLLLINPPITIHRNGINPRVHMPIGLLYIAAQLEKYGHEVKIIDCLLEAHVHPTEDKDKKHFGMSWDALREQIKGFSPKIVGISSIFTTQSPNALRTAEIVKSISQEIVTIIGGAHVSSDPQSCFENKNINFSVIGEGEYTFLKTIDYIDSGKGIEKIPGIYADHGGRKVINPTPEPILDLDDLPFPAYHLYDLERFFKLQNNGFCARPIAYGDREISIITSRGCPYNCVFCSIHPTMGKKWRAHSAEYVLKHINLLIERYNVNMIHFEDDNFSLEKKRFSQIIDGLTQMPHRIKWDPPNGLRADSLDEEIICKAMQSGCQYIVIAIESGVQKVLNDVVDKKLDLGQVEKVAAICKRLDIELYAYYVIGIPGETLSDIDATLRYALNMLRRYSIYPQIAIAAPVPGSRLYTQCLEKQYNTRPITPQTLATAYYSNGLSLIQTKEFTPKDITILQKKYNKLLNLALLLNILQHPKKIIKYMYTIKRNIYLLKKLFNK